MNDKILLDLSLRNNIYQTDIFEAALQEIEILFETRNTELIGYPNFGSNFDDYLWTLQPTTTELKEYIKELFSKLTFCNILKHHIEVNFYRDENTFESIYQVVITLYDDYKSVDKKIILKENS